MVGRGRTPTKKLTAQTEGQSGIHSHNQIMVAAQCQQ